MRKGKGVFKLNKLKGAFVFFCHGDEENEHHACMYGHLTTADQSGIRFANLTLRSKMQEMIWFGGRMKCKNVNNYMKEKQKKYF